MKKTTFILPLLSCCQWLLPIFGVALSYAHNSSKNQRGLRCLLSALVFLFMLVSARIVAQTELWGMTTQGAAGNGAIIKLNTDGSGFANYAFENEGVNPYADLLESGGKFYGMTYSGGSHGRGVLFEYDPAGIGGGTYTVKHHFDLTNGSHPHGNSLIELGGKFYGMTNEGGSNSKGVLFEYDPAGSGGGIYTVLHHFDHTNGGKPNGSLIASDGRFYGMTNEGGSNSKGVLFEYDPAGSGGGTYTVKHHFDLTNGGKPNGSLIASDSRFYGMTNEGGSNSKGVLFEYAPAGSGGETYTVLHHFDGANGGVPNGSLMVSGGKFYGMTPSGGSGDSGVLFEYDPAVGGSGIYTVKHHFDYTNGGYPSRSLIASGGKFYGMTSEGGSSSKGVLFEYDPAGSGVGTYAVKHSFNDTNGRNPQGSLIALGSKLYGMTPFGGSGTNGVLFEYDPAGSGVGTYAVKHSFNNTNGGYPQGSLIASGGKFYGMTSSGGSSGDGVLFEYDPAGSGGETYTVKHHFDGANGSNPQGNLIASGGKFYGMTSQGGSSSKGVLFEYDPAAGGSGIYTVKHNFAGINGSHPYGSLIASGGKFYGMTAFGGSNYDGVLFEYDPAGAGVGTYTVKHHFKGPNSSVPHGSLIESGGKFYGMTSLGGSIGWGTIFEYDPDAVGTGNYTVKHSFDGINGGSPYGSLVESGGKFYGMTNSGGSHTYYGVLFEYDPAGGGIYTVKHHFDLINGGKPSGSLIASGGKFYGMTFGGGLGEGGVVFEYDPEAVGTGTYTILRHLEYADGFRPSGDLIAVTLVNTTTPTESPAFEMQVSPNPSGDQVSIEIFSEKALPGNLAIFDLQGRQIAELANDRIFHGQERIVWQSADLPAGVYFLRLRTEACVYTEKFVKQ